MKKILLYIILSSLTGCYCGHHVDGQYYIAHAGGEIEGFRYTNSLEAVEHAICSNIEYIELDLDTTSDGYLVASHDWTWFNLITTGIENDSRMLSLDEFQSKKIYGRFTPLTWPMIDSIMQANPQLHLVTDKISDPKILDSYMEHFRSRVVVECFRLQHYKELRTLGYEEAFFSAPACSKREGIKKATRHPMPRHWVFHYEVPIDPQQNPFSDKYGESFAIYTVANRKEADILFSLDKRIHLIYIDNVE